MKRTLNWFLAFFFMAYIPLTVVPAEWFWYEPGIPTFGDATTGEPILLTYSRTIRRSAYIEYATVLWQAETGTPVCEGRGGPFTYHAQSGPVVGKNLKWWMGGGTCPDHLPPGQYWVDTTWRVMTPLADLLPAPLDKLLGWIVPPKSLSRASPVFTISE